MTTDEKYTLWQHGLVSVETPFRHELDLSQLVSFNFTQNTMDVYNTKQIKV